MSAKTRALAACLLALAGFASSGCSGCSGAATEHATKPAGTSTTFTAAEVFADSPAAVTAADPRTFARPRAPVRPLPPTPRC